MNKNSVFRTLIMITLVVAFGISMIIHESPAFAATEAGSEADFKKPTGYSTAIEPYISFIKTVTNSNPVDYVIHLFDKYDIVVLCERDHRDITQYELIYKIVSDPRFIEKSGCVFTEIGAQNLNGRLNKFLRTKDLSIQAVDQQLISIYRDLSWGLWWEKYNLYDFLRKVYFLNSDLPDSKKVSIHFSDIPIEWNGMTKEKYDSEILYAVNWERDKVMADFIIERYQEIKKSKSPRKKIFVIMNYRHAFKLFTGNTTEYISEAFPGKVANIMMNSLKLLPSLNNQEDVRAPVQKGQWDAAFRFLDNPNAGFDFKNTPFGKDHFDYFDVIPHKYTYQEVFNGFIFYFPLEKHLLVNGIPGFMDEKFFPTISDKYRIVFNTPLPSNDPSLYNEALKYFNEKKEQPYPDIMKYNNEIEQWLEFSK